MSADVQPEYLGDGVYASALLDAGMITLTTGSHIPDEAANVIYLDRPVIEALRAYIGRVEREIREAKQP